MALQQLRSSTANKRPTAAAMSDGQLAVNTNATNPGLFFKDADGSVRKVGPVFIGSSAPNSSPATGGSTGHAVGEQWLDNTGGTYVLKIWDGTAWRSESGTFVDASGDNMTGNLTLGSTNIVLNASNGNITSVGTATFASTIKSDGQIRGNRFKCGSNADQDNIVLAADGSATFAGTVTVDGGVTNENAIYGPGYQINTRSAAARNVFTGQLNGATTSTILADGSATFDGTVAVGNTITSSSSVDGATIYDNGTVYLSRSGSNNLIVGRQTGTSGTKVLINSDGSATFAGGQTIVNSTGWIDITRTTASSNGLLINQQIGGGTKVNTISLLSDGSATFAGDVQVGDAPDVSAQYGVEIETLGRIDVRRSDPGDITFASYSNTGTSPAAFIRGNGSAEFAGFIRSTNGNGAAFLGASTTAGLALTNSGGSTSASILYDGGASFGNTSGGSSGTGGLQFSVSNGQLDLVNTNSGSLITGYNRNSTSQVFSVGANGSATFAGDVDFGPYSESNTSSEGAVIRSSGYTVINRTSNIPALQIRQSGIANITLNAGGSATFAGQVNGLGFTAPLTLSGQYAFRGNLNGSVTSQINADGSASFGPLNISSSTGYGAQVDMAANAATVNAQCQQTASSFTLLFAGYQGTNRNFHVAANGSAYFLGNVGINQASPTSQSGKVLHVSGDTGGQARIHLTTSASGHGANEGSYIVALGAESGGSAGSLVFKIMKIEILVFQPALL
ncbi:hypothetical protein [uncultured phage MedDCM-OCT-S04-C507]|nr:hypothetical protein [uncultured phage MedDCM-OCT-S04-C507]